MMDKCRIYGIFSKCLLFIAVLTSLSGCEKWSHNGDLDGQWQVMDVSYDGVPVSFPENEIYYYNFYLHTFQLSYTGNRFIMLTGNFTYDRDILGLDLPYVKQGIVKPGLIDKLVYWGMPEDGEAIMTIKELTSDRLVMQHGDTRIVCRKF